MRQGMRSFPTNKGRTIMRMLAFAMAFVLTLTSVDLTLVMAADTDLLTMDETLLVESEDIKADEMLNDTSDSDQVSGETDTKSVVEEGPVMYEDTLTETLNDKKAAGNAAASNVAPSSEAPSISYDDSWEMNADGAGSASGIWTDSGNRESLTGAGTVTNPYSISTPGQLADLAYNLNGGDTYYASKYYILNADIDLSGHYWEPIGSQRELGGNKCVFKGQFYGNGHKITGLTISNPDSTKFSTGVGLFGSLGSGAIISGINVEDADITSNVPCTGGIVGYAEGSVTVENCSFSGNINNAYSSGDSYTGGIIGQMKSTSSEDVLIIDRCSTGNPTSISAANAKVGGIAGSVGASMNCGEVKIVNCSNNSSINYSVVLNDKHRLTGGLVGEIPGVKNGAFTFTDCVNYGAVNGYSTTGGIIGSYTSYVTASEVSNCFNYGEVLFDPSAGESTSGQLIGKIAKMGTFTVSNCYIKDGSEVSAFGSSSSSSVSGTPTAIAEADLKSESSYTGFDFGSVWTIGDTAAELKPIAVYYPEKTYDGASNNTKIFNKASTTLSPALNNTNYSPLYLLADLHENIVANYNSNIGNTPVTIELNGHDITGHGDSSVIYLNEAWLALRNSNNETSQISGGIGTLIEAGTEYEAMVGGGAYVHGGYLTIADGVIITGNTADKGAGIYADYPNCRIFMTGNASITGNTASVAGGGIYFEHGTTLNPESGSITGNYAPKGAGVYYAGGRDMNTFKLGGGYNRTVNLSILDNLTSNDVHGIQRNVEIGPGLTTEVDFIEGDNVHLYITEDTQTFTDGGYAFTSSFYYNNVFQTCVTSDDDRYVVESVEDPNNSSYFYLRIKSSQPCCIVDGVEYTSFNDALEAASNGDTIKLVGDIKGPVIFNKPNVTVTLDLNDHAIIAGTPGSKEIDGSYCDSAITVLGGNFKISDSAESKTTRYYYIDNYGLGHVVETAAEAESAQSDETKRGSFVGGYVAGGTGYKLNGYYDNAKGGSVYVGGEGSTLTMESGTIIGGSAIRGGGIGVDGTDNSFTMTGGTILGNRAVNDTNSNRGQGGGVYVGSGTVSISGGSIVYNNATGEGGGIHQNSGTASISGSTLIGHNITGDKGGGISIMNTALTMTAGTISDNYSYSSGGGVCINSGASYTLSGGSVINNSAEGGGGGIANGGGTLNVNGGTITGNKAEIYGGGIIGRLSLSGAPTITSNTSTGFGKDNVIVNSAALGGSPITITGELTNTTPIGVRIIGFDESTQKLFTDTGTITSGLSGKGGISNFTSDEEGLEMVLDASGEAIFPGVTVTRGSTTVYFGSLAEALTGAEEGDIIKLGKDADIGDGTILQKSVTIDLNGNKIFSEDGCLLAVSGSGNVLTVKDSSNSATGALDQVSVIAHSGGTVNIESGNIPMAGTAGVATLNISGGCIGGLSRQDATMENESTDGTISITGGYFKEKPDVTFIAEDYAIEGYEGQQDWAADHTIYGIRVYRPHKHEYTFSASGDTITAVCANSDGEHSGDLTTTMQIVAADDEVNGAGYIYNKAEVVNGIDKVDAPTIIYKKTGDNSTSSAAPTTPGIYTASITLTGVNLGGGSTGSVTASTKFIIRGDMIGNDDYPYGSNMGSSQVTLNVVTNNSASYQWQKRADDASEFTDISGATGRTYTFAPEDGAWYRCCMVLNGGTVYSKAVQLLKPYASSGTSKDRYDRIWTRPYGSSSYASANWYISNGTMAYYVNGTIFDVVGEFRKNNNVYMLQTVYGGGGWRMYSSETAHQAPLSSYSDSNSYAKLEGVRFAFASDRYVLNIEADLQDGQKAFSFGCDTQLGNSATSNSYADYAALDADINQRSGTLNQVTMIGAASKAAATDTDPAFVIAPLGIKSSENASLTTVSEPFVWLGRYYDRRPYKYQSVSSSTTQLTKGSLKATGLNNAAAGTLGSASDAVIAAQQIDTGMTMSWYDVPSGNTVKFRFSVGDVASTGAISGDVNYGNETLEGLDPGETYVVTAGSNTYTLSADSEGAIRLSGTDNNSTAFDLFNETSGLTTTKNNKRVNPISVSKSGSTDTPLTVDLAIRPVATGLEAGFTMADKPIDIRGDEISSVSDAVVVHLDRTSTNTAQKQKISQEYCLFASNGSTINGFGWITADAEGNVRFAGLSSQTGYLLKTRIPATKTRPASLTQDVTVKTKPAVTLTPPAESIDKNASAAFNTATGGTPKYSKALDESYSAAEPAFATAGLHTVFYRIDFDNADYGYLYGSYDVMINPTVTFHAVGGTLSGVGLSGEEGTKSIVYGKTIKEGIGTVAAVRSSGDLTAFAGWYADTGYTDLWDENTLAHTPVTEDVNLYAKWAQSLNTFGNADMTGFDWTRVTYLQLFKGNIPVSEKLLVNDGAFTFTNIPDGEYELVVTMKPGNSNTGESKVISTLCRVKKDNTNNVSIVTATPYVSDKNINSRLNIAGDTPDILVGRLDYETRDNADAYWDANLQKKTSESEDDPDVSYHVDLTLEAEKLFDWTRVNISDDQAAAGLSHDERTLRSKQAALMSRANSDEVSGLTYLDLSVTRSAHQLTVEGSEVTDTVLGTDKVDSTSNVLEIVIPWQTVDLVPKIYRYTGSAAETLTKIDNRATDALGYTDGTYYVGNGFVVVYTRQFSTFAIGCKTVAPNSAIGYGFVDYDTEQFKPTHSIGDRMYYFSDYEISTTPEFSDGTIMSAGDIVVAADKTEQTYYIRRKAQNGIPASASSSFKITRPNAPDDGMFTFTNSSTDVLGSANGVIKLNDLLAGAALQYKAPGSGEWKDILTDHPDGMISPAVLGEYQFRFEPDPANRALASTVLSHEIIKEIVVLQSVDVSGIAKFGETLNANVSGLNTTTSQPGNPTGITYQWYRVPGGSGSDAEGTVIGGAAGASYTLTAQDIGYVIYAVVSQTPEGSGTITKSSARTALVTAADGSSEKPRLKAEDISKTHNSITINYPKTAVSGVTYEYSIDGGETWHDSNIFNDLSSEHAYIPMVREKGKKETVGSNETETVKPGVSSDPITIITDENTIDVGNVVIRNMNPNNDTDTSVECGDTLAATATQTNGKAILGAAYRWMRADAEGGTYTEIDGAVGASYTLTADDLGKYLKVVASKNNSKESVPAGPVVRAVTTIAPDISESNTSVRVTSTDTTITITGLKNDSQRGICYEYGIREAGSEGEFFWQDGTTFTGLTASSSSFTSRYEVVVRIKDTPTRVGGPVSSPRTVTMQNKGMPFNAGSQTAVVVMQDYVYGTTPPVPVLNIQKNAEAGETTYYYSTDGKNWTATAEGRLPEGNNSITAGIRYIKAVIAESTKYDKYETGVTVFRVLKAPAVTTISVAGVDPDTRRVSLDSAAGKNLEYAVIPAGGTLADAVWKRVVLNDDGTFVMNDVLPAGSFTICVREKESDNYEASSAAAGSFTLEKYTVVYDANGGVGEVPATEYGVQGGNVAIANNWSSLTRTGYDFGGWSENAKENSASNRVLSVNTAKKMYAIWVPHTYKIVFETGEGNPAISAKENIKYGDRVVLPIGAFADNTKSFRGWAVSEEGNVVYAGSEVVKNLTPVQGGSVTLYACWTASTGEVGGEISSEEGSDSTIRLMQGNTQWGESKIIAMNLTSSGYSGTFSFASVPYGEYNLVIEQDVTDENGDVIEVLTKTIKVTVASEQVTFTADQLKLPISARSKLVVSGDGTPAAVVAGLDDVALSEAHDINADGNETAVTVIMNIEKKEEKLLGDDASEEDVETQTAISAIKGKAGITDEDNKEQLYLDININREVTQNGIVIAKDRLSELSKVLEILLPYSVRGRGKHIFMYYYHNDSVKNLTMITKAYALSQPVSSLSGKFYVDDEEERIHVFGKEYSTYAIIVNEDKENVPDSGQGGGGGGGTATYDPVIIPPEHGTINISPTTPESGDIVTVTVTPEEGYETENIIVKDIYGNTIPVTKNEDGTYVFTQPSTGPVSIEAVVKPKDDTTPVINQSRHGKVTAAPEKPVPGETVTITVTTEDGYEIDSVTVTDKDGNPVEVIKNADGTYSFVQPVSGNVTIEVVFRLTGGVIVKFDLNGIKGTAPEIQTFAKGEKAVKPNDPAAEGYRFRGWFTDKECTNAYDFETPVNEDLILYAGWKESGEGSDDFGIYFAEISNDPYEGVYYNAEKDRYEIVYTGAPIKPLIKVTSKADGVLKEGIDYSVSYNNNKNYSKKKPSAIKVSGKGFYKSKKVLELYILQADLEEAYDKGLIAGAEELKVQNGKKLNPVIVYRGYKLKNGDRDIGNKDKITADTTVDITGKGNFKGELKDVPVKVIGKDDQKKGAIKANIKAGKHVYNGEPQELSVTTAEALGELTVTAGSSKTPLEEGNDFVVSYSNNTDAGKATVTITGIGEYNGTVVKNFTIEADKASEVTAELAEPDEAVYFNVRGAKPDITVTAHRKAEDETVSDEVLTEGKDYKVSYSSNKKIGNGVYTVKFLGNYKGHGGIKGSFKIVQALLDDTARVEAVQMIYKKPGKYLPKPYVSLGCVQLKNSDYTVKYYEGEVADVTAEGVKELTSKDKLTLADDETEKIITVAATGKGNYTGTALGTYKVVRAKAGAIDLTKAKIVAKNKNKKGKDVKVSKQEYTGYEIEPEIRVMAKVNKKWVDVDPSLYSVSYINNLNKGSATILVTGNGEETIGSKTARFSISTMRFELFRLIFGR